MIWHTQHHGIDTLIDERHGRGAMNQAGERLYQLLPQTRLQGSERSEQLDDLDAHPIVLRSGKELEEYGRQRQIVFGILAR